MVSNCFKKRFKVLELAQATNQKGVDNSQELQSAFENIRKKLNDLRDEIKASPALKSLKETQVIIYFCAVYNPWKSLIGVLLIWTFFVDADRAQRAEHSYMLHSARWLGKCQTRSLLKGLAAFCKWAYIRARFWIHTIMQNEISSKFNKLNSNWCWPML